MVLDKFTLAAMAMNLRQAQRKFDSERISCFDKQMDPDRFFRTIELSKVKNDLEESFDQAIANNLAMNMGLKKPEQIVDTIMSAVEFWLYDQSAEDLYKITSMLRVRFTKIKEELEATHA